MYNMENSFFFPISVCVCSLGKKKKYIQTYDFQLLDLKNT